MRFRQVMKLGNGAMRRVDADGNKFGLLGEVKIR